MSRHSRTAFGTARRVADLAIDRQVTFLAAAIAYYAFVSLVPALLLLVVVATAVFGETIAAELVASTGDFLTPAGEEAVVAAVSSAGGRTGASLLGVGLLLWSTLKVFRGLDTAFVSLYGGDETPGFLRQVADAASVVVGVGVGLGVMVAVGAFVAAADAVPLVEAASVLALPALLAVVFLPMYYLLPQPTIGVREALPGAAFAAVCWTLLQAGFQVYAAGAAQYQVYGVIGGILLLVTWLYLAAVVVVLGGVVNVVLAGRGDDGGDPRTGVAADALGGTDDAADRQLQQDRDRPTGMNGESDPDGDDGERPRGAPDVAALKAEVRELRSQLDEFEDDVERRTVDKPEVESELKRYVRSRMRRGHARGWGPYLVLLYGTVLTLAALTSLDGIYAVGAIVVLGLSTLGLYTIFVVVGIGLNLIETPGKALDYARQRGDD
ncbi:ribonuclease BN [Halorubrum californiense DSM 19288]|uniref:Ribonuclease BN n=1 Tax=Halorubrum californiense DSM 19288 TaxID=1227465 RepID=M0EGA8_9EURY|nr:MULTISPECIES: YihY/virulence factor BrkB family protein [Halorubrum]ELZ46800.1 ribonuclease BN [Halorubrum californiense DSM 19288]TKX69943.1 YihY/virulence factor BrkB family protein [Halorubrum sp. GN11GM_10-3_MGM]